MRGWLPILGLAAGLGLGYFLFARLHLAPEQAATFADYVSLATLAGFDTVLGGVRSGLEGKFRYDIFVSGFILNTMLAAALAWFGDKIGIDLFLAAVVAIGTRVFLNISIIRRIWLERLIERRKLNEQALNIPISD